jgi:ribosomal protein S12 methylthiotransferase accessory factor
MKVDVRTTSTGLDASLTLLGDALRRRSAPSRLDGGRAEGPGAESTVTVRVMALGLDDAFARPPEPQPPAGTAVVPVWLHGSTILVGPRSRPDGGPCPRCVERRWQAIQPVPERHALEHGAVPTAVGGLPHLTPTAVEALWPLLARACTEAPAALGTGTVYQLRLEALDVTRTTALADSECPVCAVPAPDTATDAAALAPRSRLKPSPTSYRLRSASDLELPVDGLANPVCGTLGSQALRAYHATATTPVSGCFRVASRFDLHEMWWSGHATSYSASETLAFLEGLERYAGQFARTRTVDVFDSYANLAPAALDPSGCGYDDAFYAGHGLYYEKFSPDTAMHWVWGYSLRDREPRLVPEQLVYYLDRRADQRKFVQECSNGCASGSCVEEAMLHGMLELVERDAFLLAWYSGSRLPELDPTTCRDERVHYMLDQVRRLGYRVRLFDTRADLPIPVVTAVAERRDGKLGTLCFAAGASFDPDDAVRAALCETASYVPGFDDRVAESEPQLRAMAADYRNVTELTHHALLYGLPEMARHADFLFDNPPKRAMDDLYAGWLAARPATLDLRDDVEYLSGLIAATGGDVIAVDQTCPEQARAGMHTVAMIAPSLVPIDFGWRRQRVLHARRLREHLGRGTGPDGTGPTGLHPHPHPFP